jgi:hypothetical protein
VFVVPDQVEDALRRCVADRGFREALGARAQSFVQAHWNVSAVAGRYLQVLAGEAPEGWWCDPAKVDYLQGCGMPAEGGAARIAALVRVFGPRALFLSRRKVLRAALLRFAGVVEGSGK